MICASPRFAYKLALRFIDIYIKNTTQSICHFRQVGKLCPSISGVFSSVGSITSLSPLLATSVSMWRLELVINRYAYMIDQSFLLLSYNRYVYIIYQSCLLLFLSSDKIDTHHTQSSFKHKAELAYTGVAYRFSAASCQRTRLISLPHGGSRLVS